MTKTVSRITLRLALLAVIASMAGVAQAQQGNFSPEQMRARFDEQNKQLIEQLALTEEQQPKFLEIMNAMYEERTKMFEEMRNGGGDRTAMREKMTALNDETTKKLAKVFTEDQLKKYNDIQAERRSRFGGGRPS